MILETERLYLREMNQSDFASLCRILKDDETMYAYEGAFSDDEVREWLDRQIARYQKWGFGLWWWSYIYVWPILYFVVRWLKKFIRIDDSISWAVVLGFYGLFFGMLFSLAYILISPSYAFTYWVSGILFDVIHCIGNFCLCLIAYKPLYAILKRFR